MGTVPTAPLFVAGEKPTAAKMNQVKTFLDFLAKPPSCQAYQNTVQTLTTGVGLLIHLDGEAFDNVQSGDSPMHDTVTNNSRIVVRTPGLYEVTGQLSFVNNSTSGREIDLRLNAAGSTSGGTSIMLASTQGNASIAAYVPLTPFLYQFSAGDYVEMFGYQFSGGNLDTGSGSNRTWLRLTWKSN